MCTHLGIGTSCRCLCHAGSICRHTHSGRAREASKAGVNSRGTGSARVLLSACTPVAAGSCYEHTEMEAADRYQAGRM